MINSRKLAFTVGGLLWGMCTLLQAQTGYSETRGELLYSMHCKSCHTTIVHWRKKKLALNWPSLKSQVVRWQSNTGLGWSEDEITDVTRYLNATYYHFPVTNNQDLAEGKSLIHPIPLNLVTRITTTASEYLQECRGFCYVSTQRFSGY